MHVGHSGSRGGWRGTGSRRGGTYWDRLTYDKNTWARVTFRLRRVLRDKGLHCGVTGGFPTEGVSSGSESVGFTGEYSVC